MFVGSFVGDIDGEYVGDIDRALLAEYEGAIVGILVGEYDGDVDGRLVGDIVGYFDGYEVGEGVGSFVGAAVVPNKSSLSNRAPLLSDSYDHVLKWICTQVAPIALGELNANLRADSDPGAKS